MQAPRSALKLSVSPVWWRSGRPEGDVHEHCCRVETLMPWGQIGRCLDIDQIQGVSQREKRR